MTAAAPGTPPQSPVDIHWALNEVRQLEEFRQERPHNYLDALPPPLREWLDQIKETVDSFLQDVYASLKSLFPKDVPVPDIDWAGLALVLKYALWGLLIILGLVTVFMALVLARRLWRQRQSEQSAPILKAVDGSLLRSARFHRQEADRLARETCYESAARQLYLALLSLLDESRIVPFEANRTNLEVAGRISGMADLPATLKTFLHPGFLSVARLFEGIRFGNRSLDRGGYEQCRRDVDQLLQAVSYQQEPQKKGQHV